MVKSRYMRVTYNYIGIGLFIKFIADQNYSLFNLNIKFQLAFYHVQFLFKGDKNKIALNDSALISVK